MRQTVRLAGAADDELDDDEPEPELEPQPAAASVTAAPSAIAPSPAGRANDLMGLPYLYSVPPGGKESHGRTEKTNRKLSYKIVPLPD